MLVYDISDIKTFEKIKNYYSIKIKELCKEETYIILVGNKTDKENKRKVSQNDGLELAEKENYLFIETSCLNNSNISEAFEKLIEDWNKKKGNKNHFLDEKEFDKKYQNQGNEGLIGEGVFTQVYKRKIKDTNEFRAIKIIDFEKFRNHCESNFIINIEEELHKFKEDRLTEINNMKICSQGNKNINSVNLYEYFYNEKKFIIVMELCDNNLNKFLNKRKKGFNKDEIYGIMKQLNRTFRIMVDNNIIHRDLKLENILVNYENKQKTKYTVKLCDYGASRKLKRFSQICFSHIGTTYTMAPEILMDKKYNNKCDLWSLGIIIYELFFRSPPFTGKSELALIN